MNYLFIINPLSGRYKNKIPVIDLIQKKFGTTAEIKVTSYAGQASNFTIDAINDGYKNIVAVGGDGTMNEVAKNLIGTDVKFGIIPTGSGNGFARSLQIPLSLIASLDVIKNNKSIKIDVGLANGKYFFVVSGMGFEANVAERFQSSKRRGAIPYFYNGLKSYLYYPYQKFEIISEEYNFTIKPLTVAIANAPQYGNNAIISPDADMQDGFLDICVIKRLNLFATIKAIKYLFNGKMNKHNSYSTFKSKEITFISKQDIVFHTDGEINRTSGKIEFKIIPNALNVIC